MDVGGKIPITAKMTILELLGRRANNQVVWLLELLGLAAHILEALVQPPCHAQGSDLIRSLPTFIVLSCQGVDQDQDQDPC